MIWLIGFAFRDADAYLRGVIPLRVSMTLSIHMGLEIRSGAIRGMMKQARRAGVTPLNSQLVIRAYGTTAVVLPSYMLTGA